MKKKCAFLAKTMPLKPVEVLRKGLDIVTNHIKSRKEALQAQLAEEGSISSKDEQWLDHDANLVDELRVDNDECPVFYFIFLRQYLVTS